MKKTIFIIATILIVLLASCSQEPENNQTKPIKQIEVRNQVEDISTWYWHAQNGDTKYLIELSKSEEDRTATLRVKSYDYLQNQWPEEWIVYTGTTEVTQLNKLISETEERKEITETWMYSVKFNSVSDPLYESLIHAYDGVFEAEFVSGWNPNSKTKTGGQMYSTWGPDTVIKFIVTMNSNEAASALIGVGNWQVGMID